MSIDVCITDCNTKHGFAIARSLNKSGLKVACQYRNKLNPFFFSVRSGQKSIFDLTKQDQAEIFIKYLSDIKPKVLIPVSNLAVKLVSDNREQINEFTKTLLPDVISLEIAQNKYQTFKYAEKLGVKCPKTIYNTKSSENLNDSIWKLNFPIVLKYVNVDETGVRYCRSMEEVNAILKKYDKPGSTPPILQEFIEGSGVGFYALYKEGVCVNYFMHKRIHEYPVTGGASSYAVSIYDQELKNAGLRILNSLKWNGIAMVEFKLTKNGELYLMEINPKFWGSYELSEKCGIKFAHEYYEVALGHPVSKKSYQVDVGFRWIISEIMHYRDRLFIKKNRNITFIKHNIKKTYNDLYPDEPLILIAKIFDIIIRILIIKVNPHNMPPKKLIKSFIQKSKSIEVN